MKKTLIAATAAAVAIGATPLIVAAPASAWVPCGTGVAPDPASCTQMCQMAGTCAGPGGPPVQAAPPRQPPAAPTVPPPSLAEQNNPNLIGTLPNVLGQPPAPPTVVAAPPAQSPGPVSTWPGGVPADCANAVYAAHYNDFCASAPGGPYPLGANNPYENGTPLDNPILKP
jgi:hypothetical protein